MRVILPSISGNFNNHNNFLNEYNRYDSTKDPFRSPRQPTREEIENTPVDFDEYFAKGGSRNGALEAPATMDNQPKTKATIDAILEASATPVIAPISTSLTDPEPSEYSPEPTGLVKQSFYTAAIPQRKQSDRLYQTQNSIVFNNDAATLSASVNRDEVINNLADSILECANSLQAEQSLNISFTGYVNQEYGELATGRNSNGSRPEGCGLYGDRGSAAPDPNGEKERSTRLARERASIMFGMWKTAVDQLIKNGGLEKAEEAIRALQSRLNEIAGRRTETSSSGISLLAKEDVDYMYIIRPKANETAELAKARFQKILNDYGDATPYQTLEELQDNTNSSEISGKTAYGALQITTAAQAGVSGDSWELDIFNGSGRLTDLGNSLGLTTESELLGLSKLQEKLVLLGTNQVTTNKETLAEVRRDFNTLRNVFQAMHKNTSSTAESTAIADRIFANFDNFEALLIRAERFSEERNGTPGSLETINQELTDLLGGINRNSDFEIVRRELNNILQRMNDYRATRQHTLIQEDNFTCSFQYLNSIGQITNEERPFTGLRRTNTLDTPLPADFAVTLARIQDFSDFLDAAENYLAAKNLDDQKTNSYNTAIDNSEFAIASRLLGEKNLTTDWRDTRKKELLSGRNNTTFQCWSEFSAAAERIISTPIDLQNAGPIAHAAYNKEITIAHGETQAATTIDISESFDFDGQIQAYELFLEGNENSIEKGNNVNEINIEGLGAGLYKFKLKIIDDKGAANYLDIVITVKPPNNNAPVGQEITRRFPIPHNANPAVVTTDAISVTAVDSDNDEIIDWNFDKNVTLQLPEGCQMLPENIELIINENTVIVQDLPEGQWVIQYTATDKYGAVSEPQLIIIKAEREILSQQIENPSFGISADGTYAMNDHMFLSNHFGLADINQFLEGGLGLSWNFGLLGMHLDLAGYYKDFDIMRRGTDIHTLNHGSSAKLGFSYGDRNYGAGQFNFNLGAAYASTQETSTEQVVIEVPRTKRVPPEGVTYTKYQAFTQAVPTTYQKQILQIPIENYTVYKLQEEVPIEEQTPITANGNDITSQAAGAGINGYTFMIPDFGEHVYPVIIINGTSHEIDGNSYTFSKEDIGSTALSVKICLRAKDPNTTKIDGEGILLEGILNPPRRGSGNITFSGTPGIATGNRTIVTGHRWEDIPPPPPNIERRSTDETPEAIQPRSANAPRRQYAVDRVYPKPVPDQAEWINNGEPQAYPNPTDGNGTQYIIVEQGTEATAISGTEKVVSDPSQLPPLENGQVWQIIEEVSTDEIPESEFINKEYTERVAATREVEDIIRRTALAYGVSHEKVITNILPSIFREGFAQLNLGIESKLGVSHEWTSRDTTSTTRSDETEIYSHSSSTEGGNPQFDWSFLLRPEITGETWKLAFVLGICKDGIENFQENTSDPIIQLGASYAQELNGFVSGIKVFGNHDFSIQDAIVHSKFGAELEFLNNLTIGGAIKYDQTIDYFGREITIAGLNGYLEFSLFNLLTSRTEVTLQLPTNDFMISHQLGFNVANGDINPYIFGKWSNRANTYGGGVELFNFVNFEVGISQFLTGTTVHAGMIVNAAKVFNNVFNN